VAVALAEQDAAVGQKLERRTVCPGRERLDREGRRFGRRRRAGLSKPLWLWLITIR
jgi:hypothetical protein